MGAAELDARDPLKALAAEFHHPHDRSGRRLTYLCGHSLGLQHESTKAYVEQELADWRRLGVLGHHAAERPWIPYHEQAAAGLASLTGAGPGEVVAMNSLTVNLHLMMVSFFRPSGERTRVLIEKSAFPSDRYAVASQLAVPRAERSRPLIEVEPRPGEQTLRTEDIADRIEREGARLALVLLPGVQYLSGSCWSSRRDRRRAPAAPPWASISRTPSAICRWPCTTGTSISRCGAATSISMPAPAPSAAASCTSGMRNRRDLPRFAGWWGHEAARFRWGPQFDPIPGAEGWQVSNPPVLSTAPLLSSLAVFSGPVSRRLREKSLALTDYMRRSIEARLPGSVEIVTPGRGGARKPVEPADPSAADRGQALL